MPQFGVSKAAKLVLAIGIWSLPILAQAQATPTAAANKPASAAQEQKTPASSPTAAPAAAPVSTSASPPDYVGAEVCKTCHEDIYNGWEKTPHWKTTLDTKGGPSQARLRGMPRPRRRSRRRWRRRNKDFPVRERFRERNQRALPHLPRRRHRAHERHQLRAHPERRQLHLLPFAAPRQTNRSFCSSSRSLSFATPATCSRRRNSTCRSTIA